MEWLYLKIPYISERLNHKITNIVHAQTSPILHLHGAQMHQRQMPHR